MGYHSGRSGGRSGRRLAILAQKHQIFVRLMHLSEQNIEHAMKIEILLAEQHLMRTKVNDTILFVESCKQLSFNVS